jgi:PiT family inorganic phosphate transporter
LSHFLTILGPRSTTNLSEAIRLMEKAKTPKFSAEDARAIDAFREQIDHATKFIPTWVKVAVAIALGLGTMVGWKRIVVTVGEKIARAPRQSQSQC